MIEVVVFFGTSYIKEQHGKDDKGDKYPGILQDSEKNKTQNRENVTERDK